MASQGPWETKTEDFRDSSFMIAISVLQDAQKRILERTGTSAADSVLFFREQCRSVRPAQRGGRPHSTNLRKGLRSKPTAASFEDAVNDIQIFIGSSFPLIFIDPTGWTGYPFTKIKPLFLRSNISAKS